MLSPLPNPRLPTENTAVDSLSTAKEHMVSPVFSAKGEELERPLARGHPLDVMLGALVVTREMLVVASRAFDAMAMELHPSVQSPE